MSGKIVAISGTYRRGGTIDSSVDELLAAAQRQGAEIEKIQLLDKHIEFCTNCRSCTQTPGEHRGVCVLNDDMAAILDKLDTADAVVFASPVNFGNVTAMMKRFIERLVCYAYWPWKSMAPKARVKKLNKPAVLITSSACPAFIARLLMANPLKVMNMAAKCLGGKKIGTLYFGMTATEQSQPLSEKNRRRAHHLGIRLASNLKSRHSFAQTKTRRNEK